MIITTGSQQDASPQMFVGNLISTDEHEWIKHLILRIKFFCQFYFHKEGSC